MTWRRGIFKENDEMSKHVEIKLDPITDGIIDDMVRENVHCTDRHPRIIATNGRDRITDFREVKHILDILDNSKDDDDCADPAETGNIGAFILADISEDMEFLVVFNDKKAFDSEEDRFFVGSLVVMKIEDHKVIGLTDEELTRVKEMLDGLMYTRINEGEPYSALRLS